MEDQLKQLLAANVGNYLIQLSRQDFYGKIEIDFHKGEIVIVDKKEKFKPAFFLVGL